MKIGMTLDNGLDLDIKIKRDDDGKIIASFIIGNTTFQNQKLIIACEKGEIKEKPTKGVGVASYLDDDNVDSFLRMVRTELAKESMDVKKCSFDEKGNLIIDAKYL